MVFHVKCEDSIKGVIAIAPFLMATVKFFIQREKIEGVITILVIGILISLLLAWITLSTKYIINSDCIMIVSVFKHKTITYDMIDTVVKKKGTLSVGTPSIQQLWILNDDKVIAKLSPQKIEQFEEELNKQLSAL